MVLIHDELKSVWESCREADWDAYGAEPVSRETYDATLRFIEALPADVPPPSIGCEPDGCLTVEWYRSTDCLLSVSVGAGGMLFFAAMLGEDSPYEDNPYGSCQFTGKVPQIILDLIGQVCSASSPT